MSLTDIDKMGIASRWMLASATNDLDGSAALYAPNAVIWHNFDRKNMSAEQMLRTLGWLHRNVANLAWTEISVLPTPVGFIAQQRMTGDGAGGPLMVDSCVVVTLDANGLIIRLDEYLDPAQTAPLQSPRPPEPPAPPSLPAAQSPQFADRPRRLR